MKAVLPFPGCLRVSPSVSSEHCQKAPTPELPEWLVEASMRTAFSPTSHKGILQITSPNFSQSRDKWHYYLQNYLDHGLGWSRGLDSCCPSKMMERPLHMQEQQATHPSQSGNANPETTTGVEQIMVVGEAHTSLQAVSVRVSL